MLLKAAVRAGCGFPTEAVSNRKADDSWAARLTSEGFDLQSGRIIQARSPDLKGRPKRGPHEQVFVCGVAEERTRTIPGDKFL